MRKSQVGRREFVLGSAATLLAARVRAQAGPLTAQQVVDRIRARVGMPWRTTTVDGIKAGNPATVVTGIATTAMATMDVLRKAAAARQNFIVTQEPVFYSTNDAVGDKATDPVYLAKKQFIDDQHLVVYRFSDHWSARRPSESASALAGAAGVTNGRQIFAAASGAEPPDWDALAIHEIPETTLGALAAQVRTKLSMRGGLRIVGSPTLRVNRVFVSPEGTTLAAVMKNLARADVVIAGEPREWEAIPYTLDTGQTRSAKGMIYVGRVVSEDPGMRACASWIKSFVTNLPIEHIAVGDPYWSPLS